MTAALFLAALADVAPGAIVRVEGEEARHARIKRIEVGEEVLLADGQGHGARGRVTALAPQEMLVHIDALLAESPRREITAVQALAKGERSLLAVQMLTELGARRIVAWQADRSIVRWQGERGEKALAKWRSTAREAAKQSRRLLVPEVEAATSSSLPPMLAEMDTVLVLHEDAAQHLRDATIEGSVAVVIGPEGGITPTELAALDAIGAQQVRISDHVLRTSTAGAAALAQLEML